MVFAAVTVLFLTVISAASVRYFLEIRRICGGIVAENSATCLSSGVSARIVSTSSWKPILSISSASSRTRKRSSDRSRVPFSRWSMIRPGVPTTTWTPRRRADSCTPYAWPPYTGSTWTPCRWAAYRSNASETCSASSRVGASTSACGFFRLRSSWDRIGTANAAVLPVPVCASPTTWRPSSRAGMVAAWIGDGDS